MRHILFGLTTNLVLKPEYIHFRWWDKENHDMKYFNMQEIIRQIGFEYGIPKNIPMNYNIVLMLNTHQRDRHGTKIFQGDVVAYGSDTYHVWYNSDTASFEPLNILKSSEVTVVGNVYETPELLECITLL